MGRRQRGCLTLCLTYPCRNIAPHSLEAAQAKLPPCQSSCGPCGEAGADRRIVTGSVSVVAPTSRPTDIIRAVREAYRVLVQVEHSWSQWQTRSLERKAPCCRAL